MNLFPMTAIPNSQNILPIHRCLLDFCLLPILVVKIYIQHLRKGLKTLSSPTSFPKRGKTSFGQRVILYARKMLCTRSKAQPSQHIHCILSMKIISLLLQASQRSSESTDDNSSTSTENKSFLPFLPTTFDTKRLQLCKLVSNVAILPLDHI